jgi:hypothetical protein
MSPTYNIYTPNAALPVNGIENWIYWFGGFHGTSTATENFSLLSDGVYFLHLNQHGLVDVDNVILKVRKAALYLTIEKIYGVSGDIVNDEFEINVDNTEGYFVFRYGEQRAANFPVSVNVGLDTVAPAGDVDTYITTKRYCSWYLGYPKDSNLPYFGNLQGVYQHTYDNGTIKHQPIVYIAGYGFYDVSVRKFVGMKSSEALSADPDGNLNNVYNSAYSLLAGFGSNIGANNKVDKVDRVISFRTGIAAYVPLSISSYYQLQSSDVVFTVPEGLNVT